MLVFRAGINKMFIGIANWEDPDQSASDLGLHCLSRSFWQATSIHNFRTFTICHICYVYLTSHFPLHSS